MSKTDHVVVIGAGVAGLAAAVSLDMAGVRATVYDARPDHTDAGVSFLIRDSGLQVLDEIGLLDEVIRHSYTMPSRFFTADPSGAELEYGHDNWEEFGPASRSLSRATLLDILAKEARRRGIEIRFGKRLHSLRQHPQFVVASFTDGSQAESDLLIGADGRGSAVRACVFPQVPLQHTGGWHIYGHANTDGSDTAACAALEQGEGWLESFAGVIFMAYRDDPFDSRKVTWSLSGTTDRKIPAKSFELLESGVLLKNLETSVRNHSLALADFVAASTRIAPTQVLTLPSLPAWSSGRVALIGDAVHPIQPITGTGASFALEDGIYLAKMLREHQYLDAFYYLHADRHHRIHEMNTRVDFTQATTSMEPDIMRLDHFDVHWDQADEVGLPDLVPTKS
ncbi:FAD-dependent monooxygenase [Crossiella sp. SN42]|uniref:FAD-dependent oxidoreductase n=1 Tax=Crossiella sp. SN42 TaxID=2944808 RepID=UPI00207D3DA7|nr:NAD(P)/FAD-dependent oxidoreductase [Crossiella sp. SN42]MCO1580516.1 FAD-dependent monooxygenase [Crossiella sp. SN42]